jgi:hypothetical protein
MLADRNSSGGGGSVRQIAMALAGIIWLLLIYSFLQVGGLRFPTDFRLLTGSLLVRVLRIARRPPSCTPCRRARLLPLNRPV